MGLLVSGAALRGTGVRCESVRSGGGPVKQAREERLRGAACSQSMGIAERVQSRELEACSLLCKGPACSSIQLKVFKIRRLPSLARGEGLACCVSTSRCPSEPQTFGAGSAHPSRRCWLSAGLQAAPCTQRRVRP